MASFGKTLLNAINSTEETLSGSSGSQSGFNANAVYSADGNGLPYSKVKSEVPGRIRRNIISWFIPEFGVVRMYVNPQNMTYNHKKIITKDRTKGGFTLQYWGEDLTTIDISGTTGTSGVEGINMLYEIYRAEQYAFDSVGLTLAASSAANDLASQAVGAVGGLLGKGLSGLTGNGFNNSTASGIGSGVLGGILGTDSPNNAMSARNIMSLAQLAFTVEMYYDGWVYRGFFENMTVNEKAADFFWDYRLTFVATQKRGYRTNYLPWHRSPHNGPSQYKTPTSFDLNNIQEG